jgi:hypothetical protein
MVINVIENDGWEVLRGVDASYDGLILVEITLPIYKSIKNSLK